MQVQGVNEWFKQAGALPHLTVSGQQAQVEARATQQRRTVAETNVEIGNEGKELSDSSSNVPVEKSVAAAVKVEISNEGKNLYTESITNASTKNRDEDIPADSGNFHFSQAARTKDADFAALTGGTKEIRESNVELNTAYEKLLTDSSFEEWKAANSELVKNITDHYEERKAANQISITVSSVDMSSGFIPSLPNVAWQTPELSSAAQQYSAILQEKTGVRILTEESGFSFGSDADGKEYTMGMDLLEFMTSHSEHQQIWEGMLTGNYKNFGEVDKALRDAKDEAVADQLRKGIVGEPPDAAYIRKEVTSEIEDTLFHTLKIGQTDEERKQLDIEYTLKRYYAKHAVTSELVEQYSGAFTERNEALADVLYEQAFRSEVA